MQKQHISGKRTSNARTYTAIAVTLGLLSVGSSLVFKGGGDQTQAAPNKPRAPQHAQPLPETHRGISQASINLANSYTFNDPIRRAEVMPVYGTNLAERVTSLGETERLLLQAMEQNDPGQVVRQAFNLVVDLGHDRSAPADQNALRANRRLGVAELGLKYWEKLDSENSTVKFRYYGDDLHFAAARSLRKTDYGNENGRRDLMMRHYMDAALIAEDKLRGMSLGRSDNGVAFGVSDDVMQMMGNRGFGKYVASFNRALETYGTEDQAKIKAFFGGSFGVTADGGGFRHVTAKNAITNLNLAKYAKPQ